MKPWLCSTKNIVFVAKSFRLRFLFVLLVVLIGFSASTFAQQATIVGTVTDPSGAVVPNVTITVTNTDTSAVHKIQTNESGQFVVPDLVVGHYSVKAQAAGFKAAEQKDIALNVGDRTRIDFQMTMGGSQETVTVEANAVRIQTDSGEVSDLISGQQIEKLSTNGRSIYTLINLTPGASSLQNDFQTPTPVGGDANVSFNGARPGHNIYLLDGGEDLDRGGSGTFSVMPSLESIGEFRALTSNYSADFGLSSAATFTTVLKAGTQQFHASAWEYVRNNDLDARNFFNPAPQPVAKLNFNTYGFNVGGPVTFGKLYNPDKTKTFFFYNMEWRSLIQGGVYNQTVPNPTTYGGAFPTTMSLANLHAPFTCQLSTAQQTAFANAGQALSGCTVGTGGVLAPDPTKEVAFNNNTIPTTLLSPNAQTVLNAGIFPTKSLVGCTSSVAACQFQGGNNTPTNVREEIVRIDHQFTGKFSVF